MINPGDKVMITGGAREGEIGIAGRPQGVDGVYGMYLIQFENWSSCWKLVGNLQKVASEAE
jgi:hypothetical protein